MMGVIRSVFNKPTSAKTNQSAETHPLKQIKVDKVVKSRRSPDKNATHWLEQKVKSIFIGIKTCRVPNLPTQLPPLPLHPPSSPSLLPPHLLLSNPRISFSQSQSLFLPLPLLRTNLPPIFPSSKLSHPAKGRLTDHLTTTNYLL